MSENNSIINLSELGNNIKLAKQEGNEVVINDAADKAVAAIKIAEKQIDDAIDIIRELAKEALEPFNAKTLRGKYVSITVSAPRKVNEYSVDEEADPLFTIQQTKITPNKEAIEEFIETKGFLPDGVHRNELKRSVTIKLKQNAIDDYEASLDN